MAAQAQKLVPVAAATPAVPTPIPTDPEERADRPNLVLTGPPVSASRVWREEVEATGRPGLEHPRPVASVAAMEVHLEPAVLVATGVG